MSIRFLWFNQSYFVSRLIMIVQVNAALYRTVVDSDGHFDNLSGVSHLQSQSEFYHVSYKL